jgi:hypothetical protein
MLIDIVAIRQFLYEVVIHYQGSAPTVATWADDLYIRLGENPGAVPITEILTAQRLTIDGQWALPTYAANIVFKQMDALGQDTTGHFGF